MDIRKCVNCGKATAAVFVLVLSSGAAGEAGDLRALLRESESRYMRNAEAAKGRIAALKEAMAEGGEDAFLRRGAYRIGMLYFQMERWEDAERCFLDLVQSEERGGWLGVCSGMMLGQTYRLAGEGGKSLEALEKVCQWMEESGELERYLSRDGAEGRMWIFARMGRGEILEGMHKIRDSRSEYESVLGRLGGEAVWGGYARYGAMAAERIARLYFLEGDADRYLHFAGRVVREYPTYERAPFLAMESLSAEILRGSGLEPDWKEGAERLPGFLAGRVRTFSREVQEKTAKNARELAERYRGHARGTAAGYWYGCILEETGDQEAAREEYERILEKGAAAGDVPGETIRSEAQIRLANLLLEKEAYLEAKAVLEREGPESESAQTKAMKKSLMHTIETLRREDGNHEQAQTKQ